MIAAAELKALQQNEEITLFEGEPLPAQRDFELWVDQAGHPHYEHRTQADAKLLAIAKDYIRQAEQALQEGRTEDAERYCGIALCADDRLIEPLAIKAALRRLKKDATGERLMAKLAEPRMSEAAFRRMVEYYFGLSAPVREALVLTVPRSPDLLSLRVMFGMAEMRAA